LSLPWYPRRFAFAPGLAGLSMIMQRQPVGKKQKNRQKDAKILQNEKAADTLWSVSTTSIMR
jgi:hypothetical protein